MHIKSPSYLQISKVSWLSIPAENEEAALTLNEEEEAENTHGCNDYPWYDERQAPVGGDPVASNQRAQDVAHWGVRVPQPHDESTPDRKTGSQHVSIYKLNWNISFLLKLSCLCFKSIEMQKNSANILNMSKTCFFEREYSPTLPPLEIKDSSYIDKIRRNT